MTKVKRVRYFTKERKALISDDNRKLYKKYLMSSIIKNKDVKETTYLVYENYFNQFLVYLSEEHDNIGLYSKEFMEDAVDIMEGFISFCQETLFNNKKVINTKLSAISSFYLWSMKRGEVKQHPFDKKLDRMKNANEEKIINSYFLTRAQVDLITKVLADPINGYDIQDRLIWAIAMDSANRIGALSKLTISSLDKESMVFGNIREKRGYKVEVTFCEETLEIIKNWLEQRKEMDNLECDGFFISFYGKEYRQMSKSAIQERVRKIGHIIDLDDFHIHCIRKTALNLIVEETGSIELAADLANHKSIETTRSHYTREKSKSETRQKIAELRAKMDSGVNG